MNNFITSIIGIIVFTSVISLMGNFFDIDPLYYIPFMMWIIAILIFNMFLEKEPSNLFMQDIQNV
tara:strand:- start:1795 stop:1989 length:195 start_codon:yes stop_codon:yes gene_type:complete